MNVYGTQISPVVLCMQYSVISTRSTCLYGSQCFFARKIATFGAELQLSMGPRPHLSFSACKTAWIASEILVSMGPCPHLWFLDAKQRLFDQNYKSLWVPVLPFRFCLQNSDFWSRITSPYRSQTSPVVLCMQNSMISIRPTGLSGSQPSSVVFTFKTVHYGHELLVSLGQRPYRSFSAFKTASFAAE